MSNKVEKYYLVSVNNNGFFGSSSILTLTPRKKTFIIASALVEENCCSKDVLEVIDFITNEKIVKDTENGFNIRGLSFDSLMPFDDYQFADYVSAEFKNNTMIHLYYNALKKIKQCSIKKYDEKHIYSNALQTTNECSIKNYDQTYIHAENDVINEVRVRARKFLGK